MIPRYSLPEMTAVWSEEARFSAMLEIEVLACEAWAGLGRIPRSAAHTIRRKAKFDIARIHANERRNNHEIIAFLEEVQRHVGPPGRFIHLGMTSSDVMDTAASMQCVAAVDLLLPKAKRLEKALASLARRYRNTPTIGRSHGIHAEPVTFGWKMAGLYAEARRTTTRLKQARTQAAVGKISGAVGTYVHLDPRVESYICRKLGIRPAEHSTQVVPRDHHAEFLALLAIAGASLERMAMEVRHLQRTEVLEAEEYFSPTQKGSSAMPHKRNPVASERICGMARLLRGYAMVGFDNVALWHERDISHSSAERVALADACLALDFMLSESCKLFERLVVYPKRMLKNLELSRGCLFSQRVLLALIDAGMPRTQAYETVQRHALAAWAGGDGLKARLEKAPEVTKHLRGSALDACFDLKPYLARLPAVYRRLGL